MDREIDDRRLLDTLALAVLATDADGIVTFGNAAASRELGVEVVGRHLDDLLGGPEAGALPRAPYDVAGWRGDVEHVRGDDVRVLAVHVRASGGDGAVVTIEDVTDVRRAHAEATADEHRLRLAHEAAELGTWHWNAVDGTNVWDEQMHRIYGLPPGGFDGTWDAWVASIHPDDRSRVIAEAQQALADRSTYVLRNRIVRPDGEQRWIEAHGKVLVDDEGAPAGTIGCLRDVTERVQMEQRAHDDAARAVLLQEVTADFSRASTPDEVVEVLARSLGRVREIVGSLDLAVPDDLASVTSGAALLATPDVALSREDARFLDTLAVQCSIAAERASLFRHTADIAEELQRTLAASPLPQLTGVEVAAHYAPGGDELEQIGGDWYDAVGMSGGALALVVGDVMGRGVRAATTMIHVRAGIRGLMTLSPDPGALLAAADGLVARYAPDQFVTATAVLLDPESETLEVVNAGHVPVVLVRPDGTVEVIGLGTGLPLGVEPGVPRPAHRAPAPRGSLVVVVTDGVVESRTRDIDEGIDRLRDRAGELRDRPLVEVVAALAGLADDRLHDDVTVVAARLR